jgi:hypothetical protein
MITPRLVQLAACAAFVVASVPFAAAAPVTVKGEVVDQACYTKDKTNVGAKHKDCGLTCAKKGGKLALVTADGQVYTITGAYTDNKNEKLIDAFASQVEVTGEVSEKGGAKEINVTSMKKAA